MADFSDLQMVLDKKTPNNPTLFEFYLNVPLLEEYSGLKAKTAYDHTWNYELLIPAYRALGYSYVTMLGSDFHFYRAESAHKSTISLNDSCVIVDRKSFLDYHWPEAKDYDFGALGRAEKMLDRDKKLIVWSNGGVLENVIALVGYENLCIMLYEDRTLVEMIFQEVGERLLSYYIECLKFDGVGAVICNDDWGFNTQTMLSAEDLRKLVFPYHRRIVEYAHSKGRHAILHSCGNLETVYEDIICDMKFDAKHSFQDNIMSVEQSYEKYGKRLAILGGLDIDFLSRGKPLEITERSVSLLKMGERGGYALGSGNSIPEYIPKENYLAMLKALAIVKYGE